MRNVASYTEKSTVISAKRNLVHNLIDVSLIGFGQYNVGKYAWSRLGVKFGNTFYNNVRPCVNFRAEFGYSILELQSQSESELVLKSQKFFRSE